MELLIFVTLQVMLVVAAMLKGVDSTEVFDSPEWERRKLRGTIV